jgi:hypothetical protein
MTHSSSFDAVTELSETILSLLEEAEIPAHINNKIMVLLLQGEHERNLKRDAQIIDILAAEYAASKRSDDEGGLK